ncbi:MAG: DUF4160 domain-containing protein [Candidatus Binatia bacterium]
MRPRTWVSRPVQRGLSAIRPGVTSSPKRALRLVLEWYDLHRNELLEDWELAAQRRPLKRIPPLE